MGCSEDLTILRSGVQAETVSSHAGGACCCSLITPTYAPYWQSWQLSTPNSCIPTLGFASSAGGQLWFPHSGWLRHLSVPDSPYVFLLMSASIQAAQRQRCGSRRCRRGQRRIHSRGCGDELPQS